MSSQTPGPAAKRRRVEVANAALRKPFRSPLLTRSTAPSAAPPPGPEALIASTPTRSSTAISRSGTSGRRVTNAFSTPIKKASYAASPLSRGAVRKSLGAETRLSEAVGGSPAQEKIRKLQQKMAAAKRRAEDELALVRQAAKIQRESNAKRPREEIDAELKDLVEKWKGASRLAADELFELIKGRVDSMGGAKAWRETRKRQERGFDGFDGEDSKKTDEDEAGDRDEDLSERESDVDDEEEGFTMLMMLKSLNIEPELLGYDPVEDKWIE